VQPSPGAPRNPRRVLGSNVLTLDDLRLRHACSLFDNYQARSD
jgi:hypothetical protein